MVRGMMAQLAPTLDREISGHFGAYLR
jgi:hypothetical protein